MQKRKYIYHSSQTCKKHRKSKEIFGSCVEIIQNNWKLYKIIGNKIK